MAFKNHLKRLFLKVYFSQFICNIFAICVQHYTLRAFLHGRDMLLTSREFSILLYLLKNEGKTIPAKDIYENVWKQPMSGNANAVWKSISRLKNKLTDADGEIALLSFRNEGYLLEIISHHT